MQGASASPVLSLSPSSPSFSSYSSANLAEIAARVVEEFRQQEPEDSEDIFDINWERERQQEEDRRGSSLDDDVVLFSQQKHEEEEEEEEEEEFEFAVVCNKKQECSSITADEIFFNGQIKPLYPLFNRDLLLYNYDQNNAAAPSPAPAASPTTTTTTTGRPSNRLPLGKLMSEERETSVSCSCSSSEADDLDNLTPGTYCVWTPKPSKESQSPGRSCKKSHSTGSNSKRWKFRDLLYRSNSDGKDTFVFFTPLVTGNHHNKKATAARHRHHRHQDTQDYNKSSSRSATGTGKAADKATVNKEHYVRNRSVKEENKKRSFLPYRKDLVGFFSNVNM
ncbi:hypothetical protein CUMW_104210 [Citrus unshiu]|nr:hypothetical protein CUMW_104210 [Citrus unshiu]